MKNSKWFKLIGAAVLGLMILGFAVPSGHGVQYEWDFDNDGVLIPRSVPIPR